MAYPDHHDEVHRASLRERKKVATRQALRAAATRLIGDRGLHAVTVEDIAGAANVSTRTFFNYFASKEDAVVGWDPDLIAELLNALRERPTEELAFAALSAVLVETIGSFGTEPRAFLDRLSVIRREPQLLATQVARWADIERQLVDVLAERQVREACHPGVLSRDDPAEQDPAEQDPAVATGAHAALVVATALAACRVAVMTWCERNGTDQITDLVSANLDTLAAGLSEPSLGRSHNDD